MMTIKHYQLPTITHTGELQLSTHIIKNDNVEVIDNEINQQQGSFLNINTVRNAKNLAEVKHHNDYGQNDILDIYQELLSYTDFKEQAHCRIIEHKLKNNLLNFNEEQKTYILTSITPHKCSDDKFLIALNTHYELFKQEYMIDIEKHINNQKNWTEQEKNEYKEKSLFILKAITQPEIQSNNLIYPVIEPNTVVIDNQMIQTVNDKHQCKNKPIKREYQSKRTKYKTPSLEKLKETRDEIQDIVRSTPKQYAQISKHQPIILIENSQSDTMPYSQQNNPNKMANRWYFNTKLNLEYICALEKMGLPIQNVFFNYDELNHHLVSLEVNDLELHKIGNNAIDNLNTSSKAERLINLINLLFGNEKLPNMIVQRNPFVKKNTLKQHYSFGHKPVMLDDLWQTVEKINKHITHQLEYCEKIGFHINHNELGYSSLSHRFEKIVSFHKKIGAKKKRLLDRKKAIIQFNIENPTSQPTIELYPSIGSQYMNQIYGWDKLNEYELKEKTKLWLKMDEVSLTELQQVAKNIEHKMQEHLYGDTTLIIKLQHLKPEDFIRPKDKNELEQKRFKIKQAIFNSGGEYLREQMREFQTHDLRILHTTRYLIKRIEHLFKDTIPLILEMFNFDDLNELLKPIVIKLVRTHQTRHSPFSINHYVVDNERMAVEHKWGNNIRTTTPYQKDIPNILEYRPYKEKKEIIELKKSLFIDYHIEVARKDIIQKLNNKRMDYRKDVFKLILNDTSFLFHVLRNFKKINGETLNVKEMKQQFISNNEIKNDIRTWSWTKNPDKHIKPMSIATLDEFLSEVRIMFGFNQHGNRVHYDIYDVDESYQQRLMKFVSIIVGSNFAKKSRGIKNNSNPIIKRFNQKMLHFGEVKWNGVETEITQTNEKKKNVIARAHSVGDLKTNEARKKLKELWCYNFKSVAAHKLLSVPETFSGSWTYYSKNNSNMPKFAPNEDNEYQFKNLIEMTTSIINQLLYKRVIKENLHMWNTKNEIENKFNEQKYLSHYFQIPKIITQINSKFGVITQNIGNCFNITNAPMIAMFEYQVYTQMRKEFYKHSDNILFGYVKPQNIINTPNFAYWLLRYATKKDEHDGLDWLWEVLSKDLNLKLSNKSNLDVDEKTRILHKMVEKAEQVYFDFICQCTNKIIRKFENNSFTNGHINIEWFKKYNSYSMQQTLLEYGHKYFQLLDPQQYQTNGLFPNQDEMKILDEIEYLLIEANVFGSEFIMSENAHKLYTKYKMGDIDTSSEIKQKSLFKYIQELPIKKQEYYEKLKQSQPNFNDEDREKSIEQILSSINKLYHEAISDWQIETHNRRNKNTISEYETRKSRKLIRFMSHKTISKNEAEMLSSRWKNNQIFNTHIEKSIIAN